MREKAHTHTHTKQQWSQVLAAPVGDLSAFPSWYMLDAGSQHWRFNPLKNPMKCACSLAFFQNIAHSITEFCFFLAVLKCTFSEFAMEKYVLPTSKGSQNAQNGWGLGCHHPRNRSPTARTCRPPKASKDVYTFQGAKLVVWLSLESWIWW